MTTPPQASTASTTNTQIRPIAVVFNPATRGGVKEGRAEEIQAAFSARGFDPAWYETTESDPGDGAASKALDLGARLVCVSGGDGTVMAVATELSGTGVPLAVLPGGTGNLLAVNLDIPLDLDEALDVALEGDRTTIDVGVLGDKRFLIMAGLGFDAALLRDTPAGLKGRLGAVAYLVGALRNLRRSATLVQVIVDGKVIERRAQQVLVANFGRLQGAFPPSRMPTLEMGCSPAAS